MAKFNPGQSGNPGGRPVIVKHIQELARQHTPEALQALLDALKIPGERVLLRGDQDWNARQSG